VHKPLIHAGADIGTSSHQKHPVHMAAETAQYEILEKLIELNPDLVNHKDNTGKTNLSLALKCRNCVNDDDHCFNALGGSYCRQSTKKKSGQLANHLEDQLEDIKKMCSIFNYTKRSILTPFIPVTSVMMWQPLRKPSYSILIHAIINGHSAAMISQLLLPAINISYAVGKDRLQAIHFARSVELIENLLTFKPDLLETN